MIVGCKMKKILIVSTNEEIDEKIGSYINSEQMPNAEYTLVQERYGTMPLIKTYVDHYIPIYDIGDIDEVRNVAEQCRKWGPYDWIVQTDEYSVILKEKIYTILQEKNNTFTGEILRFRDKQIMKEKIKSIRVPQIYSMNQLAKDDSKFPVIVKPRSFAASEGIYFAKNYKELQSIMNDNGLQVNTYDDNFDCMKYEEAEKQDVEIEEYIDGKTYHIDGYIFNGMIEFCEASQYLNSCLEFAHGKALGSLHVNDKHEQILWKQFVEKLHKDLHFPDGAFHVEAFKLENGERIFLELAIRPGGGLIVETTEVAQGVDLLLAHILCQIGEKPKRASRRTDEYGFLLMSNMSLPYANNKVKNVNKPKASVKTLIKADFPYDGDVIKKHHEYRDVYGEFMFMGEKRNQVKEDMLYIMDNYKIDVTEV